MIIDVHTHAFPKEIRADRERFFHGEAAFRMLYDSPKARLAGVEETVAMMDEEGVDRSVVFGFPWKDAEVFRRNNDYILDAVARFPRRLTGLCCMDPFHPAAARELERCIQAGASGMGELAFYESGIDEDACMRMEPLMDLCREHNLPALIHTNEPVGRPYPGKSPNTLKQIYGLLQCFPDNRIILAHWGGGLFFYSLLRKEVRETMQNVWFDTAASPFLYEPSVYRIACELVGAGKILLGSDFPLLRPSRYFRDLEASGISEAEHAAICGENAATLFPSR